MIIIPRANSATWTVDLPAGSDVTIVVRDASGELAGTFPRVVGRGSGDCLALV